jgi:outer membrane protein OmpA-like peptidoglycan-associated protein
MVFLAGIVILVFPASTEAQADLERTKEELDELIDGIKIDESTDISDVREIQELIDELIKKMKDKDYDDVVIDYFRANYAAYDLACERFLRERERIHWTESGKLKSLKRKLRYLLRIDAKTRSGKSYESSGAISGVLEGVKRRELELVGIPNDPSREFCRSIHTLFSEELNEEVETYEGYIYDLMVPDGTIRQLEAYVDFAVYADEVRYSPYLVKAYELLYEFYTRDGQLITLELYEKNFENPTVVSYQIYQDHLKERFDREKRIAAKLEKYLVSGRPLQDGQYQEILAEAPNKELAFLALQRMIEEDVTPPADYGRATEKIGAFLSTPRLSDENKAKARGLLDIIRALENQSTGMALSEIEGLNTAYDETQFVFDESGQLLFIPPQRDGERLRHFEKAEQGWASLDRGDRFNRNNIFWYDEGATTKDQIIEIPKLQFDVSDLGDNHFFVDFFLSYKHNIAFFVSTSDRKRYVENADSREEEYISAGLVNPAIGLQDYGSVPYHGKQNGNANTDIYYSIREGKDWLSPKVLKDVNTPYSERSPVLSEDGQYLYFSSEGKSGLGGYDVFQVRVSSIAGREITVEPASLKNISEVNSPADELFYQKKNDTAYVSSNRMAEDGTQDFDVYEVVPVERSPVPETSQDDTGSINKEVISTGELNFTLDCRLLSKKTGRRARDGHVFMEGRIVDENNVPFKKAEIKFSAANVDNPYVAIIDLERYPNDTYYSKELPHGRRYKVQVFGYNENGDTLEAYSEERLDLCSSDSPYSVSRQDFKLERNGEKSLKDGCITSKMPFFFKTAKHDINGGILNLNMLEKHYDKVAVSAFKTDPDIHLILVGSADERGDPAYNYQLASDRVNAASLFLVNSGFPRTNIISRVVGETSDYNGESVEEYKDYFDYELSMTWEYDKSQDIDYLLNRRVEVLITANPNKCLEKL